MFVKVPRNTTEIELGYMDSKLDEISYLVMVSDSTLNNEIIVTVFGKDEIQTKVGRVDRDHSNYFEFEFDEGEIIIVRVSITKVSINISIDKQ